MSIEIINSEKFANISDVVYSEITTQEKFQEVQNKNKLRIIDKTNTPDVSLVWYVAEEINVSDGDIIFCQTELVKYLFQSLYDLHEFKNITLITNQSDLEIDEELYNLKPACISKWYSTNVNFDAPNLIPIPIGVNNSYIKKFVQAEDFEKTEFKGFIKKNDIYYLNYNLNTNPFHRLHTAIFVSRNNKAILNEPTVTKKTYLNDLDNAKFTICPWGNGYDSHRIWESIYANSIAITKSCKAFESFNDLPIIQLKTFKNFKRFSFDNRKIFNMEKADFRYWNKLLIVKSKEFKNKSYKLDCSIHNQQFIKDKNTLNKKTYRFKKRRSILFRSYKLLVKVFSNSKLREIL